MRGLKPVPPGRLLAKSTDDPEQPKGAETLRGHTAAVIGVAEAIFETTGRRQLIAVGLDPAVWFERFRRVLLLAAWLHDLGKASDQFQDMVRGLRKAAQALRHETLSYVVVKRALEPWLTEVFSKADLVLALLAAAGHHRKFPPGSPKEGSGWVIKLWLDHSDFQELLELGRSKLGLGAPPPLTTMTIEDPEDFLAVEIQSGWTRDDQEFLEAASQEERVFLAVLKASLIAADVGGSALPKEGKKLKPWVKAALARGVSAEELAAVVACRLGEHELRPFQRAVGESTNRRTLALAGCGTGKTLAAYHWASKIGARRLFFCYPTTGTTTEGYRDYLHEPDLKADLVHSRRWVDLDFFALHDDESDVVALRSALECWDTPVTCCTVDTVLGLVQNQQRPVFNWPSITQAAFVFDEIHAYDSSLFGALLRFLEALPGLPCLLMTASLPRPKLEALRRVARDQGGLDEIPGPPELEAHPRYQQVIGEPESLALEAWERGQKVLWVCNTVNRALDRADVLAARGVAPLVYHSRFRYRDRVARHRDVVEAFRGDGGVIAVTTQVCEMSLDISADLLITDEAPVPALIQRLGRLNRRARPGDKSDPGRFLLVEVERAKALPYTAAELDQARDWLGGLGAGPLSQAELAAAWAAIGADEPVAAVESAWLDGGVTTQPRSLRDMSPGLDVFLPEDADKVRAKKAWPAELRLPMTLPRGQDWKSWYDKELTAYVPPAGALDYDPMRGGRWTS